MLDSVHLYNVFPVLLNIACVAQDSCLIEYETQSLPLLAISKYVITYVLVIMA